MAVKKTDDEVRDAQIPGNEGDDDARGQEQDTPKDVRGALRAAIKEQQEKENSDEGEVQVHSKEDDKEKLLHKRDKSKKEEGTEDTEADNKKDKRSGKAVSEENDATSEENDESAVGAEDEGRTDEISKEEKLEPIGFWKTKGKDTWDKLDKAAQQAILNREQEVSEGFRQISQRFQPLAEVEKVLAPRLQSIQSAGYQPAQIVDRLFQYMEALGNQDQRIKLNTLKDLARSFGVDIKQLAPKQVRQNPDGEVIEEEDNTLEYDPNTPPPWFGQYAQNIESQVKTVTDLFEAQKREAANVVVSNWAKDKEYYADVRQLMGQLIQSGAVPLKDGQIDLDGAYEAACKVHPQVSAQIQQKKVAQEQAAAKARAAKAEKDRAAKVAAARRASVGIRPNAASANSGASNKLNGKTPKLSVRDSIRAAMDEARE